MYKFNDELLTDQEIQNILGASTQDEAIDSGPSINDLGGFKGPTPAANASLGTAKTGAVDVGDSHADIVNQPHFVPPATKSDEDDATDLGKGGVTKDANPGDSPGQVQGTGAPKATPPAEKKYGESKNRKLARRLIDFVLQGQDPRKIAEAFWNRK